MRITLIWSFLGLAALATGGLATGCDGDSKVLKSAVGESCAKTSDCDDGLRCLQGTCYKAGGGAMMASGGEGNTDTPPVGPPPPVLGKLGESCTKRADCEDGLACIAQRCSEEGTGMGGAGPTGPTLGGPGETCGLTSDCSAGLSCLPNGLNNYADFQAKVIGSNSVGVCTPIDSGVTPTGKTCNHECATAADCCELPVAAQGTLGAYSCADLSALVADVPDCDTAIGLNGAICLAYSAYCDKECGKNTWACDAGLCQYTAKCTKATDVVGGCPRYTRGGHAVSACNLKTSKCEPTPTTTVGCTSDAKCSSPTPMLVADGNGDTCSEGECACDVDSGGCYRKCSEDLDCQVGYRCDDKSSLCVAVDSCTSDLQCVLQHGDSRATCVDGACAPPPCEHDIDCNPAGLVNGEFRAVCGPDKTCVSLTGQCSSDDECGPYTGTQLAGNVRSFCTDEKPSSLNALPKSAITD